MLVVFQLALYHWWETCKLKAGIRPADFQMKLNLVFHKVIPCEL